MAAACGVITRRQFAGYLAERRRLVRQRSTARRRRRRRRGRAGRRTRHGHAPPSLAGPTVAVHRVELQGPLECGARHGVLLLTLLTVVARCSRAHCAPSTTD